MHGHGLDFADSPTSTTRRAQPVRGVAPWFGYTVGTLVGIASIIFIFEALRIEYILNRAAWNMAEKMNESKDEPKSRR
jgi:hypothetical protein